MDRFMKNCLKGILVLVFVYLGILVFPKAVGFLKILIKIILPFLISFTIAFVLNPLVRFFEKRLGRKFALFLTLFLFFTIVIGLGFLFVQTISTELESLSTTLPKYFQQMEREIGKLAEKHPRISAFVEEKLAILSTKILSSSNFLADKVTGIIQTTISYLFPLLITPVLIIYFLISFEKIIAGIKKIITIKQSEELERDLREANQVMASYFRGFFLIMFLLTFFSSLSFLLIGLDAPILLGLIVGITDIIPYFGPYIGGVVAIFFAMGDSLSTTLVTLLALVLLQFLENNFLVPIVQSKTAETHPILVILMMSLLSEFLGIFGLIIAVPFLSLLQIFFKNHFVQKKVVNDLQK